MTRVLITVDTELSAGLHQRGASAQSNFEDSVLGRVPGGDVGIEWQMAVLDHHDLKGVFFVDPMPALVLGEQVVADIVGPVLARGHDVQLHAHTEWLAWAKESPVAGRTGRSIGDFSRGDQVVLLSLGCDLLERAGAPRPIAFRAGNFGANDDTLAALAALGLIWDSSVNADYLSGACRIAVAPGRNLPLLREGVVELPVSGLFDRPGHFRPAQLCALSSAEMAGALRHAAADHHPVFTVVTHSFEMMTRDRQRANPMVMRRFEALARLIARDPRLDTATFPDLDPIMLLVEDRPRWESNQLRTMLRIGGQAWSALRHERRLRAG